MLASLIDGVRASGNVDVHVKMTYTNRGFRLGSLINTVDEEVESWHLKFLQLLPGVVLIKYLQIAFNYMFFNMNFEPIISYYCSGMDFC